MSTVIIMQGHNESFAQAAEAAEGIMHKVWPKKCELHGVISGHEIVVDVKKFAEQIKSKRLAYVLCDEGERLAALACQIKELQAQMGKT